MSAIPSSAQARFTYATRGGLRVCRTTRPLTFEGAVEPLIAALDSARGGLFAGAVTAPGRYRRQAVAFIDPPLAVTACGDTLRFTALNARGSLLMEAVAPVLLGHPDIREGRREVDGVIGRARRLSSVPVEEMRTRQPGVFSVLRSLIQLFASDADPHLGLYGAFGYDLMFQLEPLRDRRPVPADQRDLVLYLPDRLVVVDGERETAREITYEFQLPSGAGTAGLPRRDGARMAPPAPVVPEREADLPPGGYAAIVETALPYFARGDLFEVVPSSTRYRPAEASPATVYRALAGINPSPYQFLLNLGFGEYLVGASPEMFVRVAGRRVETCPISGTARRGRDALEDAEAIRTLLNSAKDEAELTMCTDVDRNDKARVCEPGSVRVIGRRMIELYSHLIHTVDHVEGRLGAGYDALDALLTHCWAVTVTGAPKRDALVFLEAHEPGVRRWYGGAVGRLGFDGDMETGMTLRTLRIAGGVAEIRTGATLLADSDPHAEEAETELKAAAMVAALAAAAGRLGNAPARGLPDPVPARPVGTRRPRVLLVDCEDSFVHMLAGNLRAAGGEVETRRHGFPQAVLDAQRWGLVVLSPGPGRPERFGLAPLIAAVRRRGIGLFGVCLGLQAIVEAHGGTIGQMPVPMHGKPSQIRITDPESRLFAGLETGFTAGRYHSLHATHLPACLSPTAEAGGVIMAVEHREAPVAGVQFHPESVMTLAGAAGERILANALAGFAATRRRAA